MPVFSHGCESTSPREFSRYGFADTVKRLRQCGLVVYCALQLTPLFIAFAGVHQWDIMQKDLVEWVQVSGVKRSMTEATCSS